MVARVFVMQRVCAFVFDITRLCDYIEAHSHRKTMNLLRLWSQRHLRTETIAEATVDDCTPHHRVIIFSELQHANEKWCLRMLKGHPVSRLELIKRCKMELGNCVRRRSMCQHNASIHQNNHTSTSACSIVVSLLKSLNDLDANYQC